jgi:hypothetical protein
MHEQQEKPKNNSGSEHKSYLIHRNTFLTKNGQNQIPINPCILAHNKLPHDSKYNQVPHQTVEQCIIWNWYMCLPPA